MKYAKTKRERTYFKSEKEIKNIHHKVGTKNLMKIKEQFYFKVKSLMVLLCPTLCNSMDYSPPGSSVHGIL